MFCGGCDARQSMINAALAANAGAARRTSAVIKLIATRDFWLNPESLAAPERVSEGQEISVTPSESRALIASGIAKEIK